VNFFSNIGKILARYGIKYVQGTFITLFLSVISVLLGSFLGLFISLVRMSKHKWLSRIAIVYIEILRGTPMLLQLYLFWILLPKIPGLSNLGNLACVCIALVINSSAYMAEVFRAGIQAVDPGQREAAVSLGMKEKDIMLKVIFPQALRNILPAMGNEFIVMIKETSLASTFMAGEIMTTMKQIQSITYLALESLTIAGIIYLILTLGLSKLLSILERRLNANG
jgi:His/Glu/Gln/Arg/opine family amino acid ABC transporter permease subunit